MKKMSVVLFSIGTLISISSLAQHSVARIWNEALLGAIRKDYARPTVHARNLFHTSVAMYDSWAAYDETATPYLLGKYVHGFHLPFEGINKPQSIDSVRQVTISYACYRLLAHRFQNSPNVTVTQARFDFIMDSLDLNTSVVSTDYSSGSAAALGNYIAEGIIDYGFQDGSNEQNKYENLFYKPVNQSLIPDSAGNPRITDPNRWQPLTLELFIDQAGNVTKEKTPTFLSPEWGRVLPFSLSEEDKTTYTRNGDNYEVYHDPGKPPYMEPENPEAFTEEYKWTFELVSVWSSHLHPSDSVKWDISPASLGNIDSFPNTLADYHDFYDLENGGDPSKGHAVNPITNLPYEPNIVYRGDYTRILAEFWADGPDSETPPGHWFTILNYVNDHPLHENRLQGKGQVLNDLEWDVKSYFTLAGTMHDAAISAWGIKGWYDYIRPICAIRYMADQGQSSDMLLPNYSLKGIDLIPGFIELVDSNDALVGADFKNLNKIKLYAWKGPGYISNPETDVAEVGWILAENWWPYQRPSFITPPFAGYISGHSTYSRAAAEVMTALTGDAYFPGGMGVFHAAKNEFLVFEDGPSESIDLQWATYRDASDQCSLSRIWGGIHPPADDMPGRKIGEIIGNESFDLAIQYFDGVAGLKDNTASIYAEVYPTISNSSFSVYTKESTNVFVYSISGVLVDDFTLTRHTKFGENLTLGVYFVKIQSEKGEKVIRIIKGS